MSEYLRTDTRQFVDSELVMIIDTHTGDFLRFGNGNSATGPFDMALRYVAEDFCNDRLAIIRIAAVIGYRLDGGGRENEGI